MNMEASECSSGCESGWTHYLDQSSVSATQCQRAADGGVNVGEDYGRKLGAKEDDNEEEEEEEEDLSMVSDASSGPPHFQEDERENGFFSCSASQSAKKSEKKMKMKNYGSEQQRSYLDDTASSPVLSFSKKSLPLFKNQGPADHVLNFSQGGFSATHFKGKSAFQKHLGFFKSSIHGKPPSK